jgi:hypothetical protein
MSGIQSTERLKCDNATAVHDASQLATHMIITSMAKYETAGQEAVPTCEACMSTLIIRCLDRVLVQGVTPIVYVGKAALSADPELTQSHAVAMRGNGQVW